MSAKVDQRVVSLKFDNQQFEQGVKQTMTTLDNLNKGLKLKDAAQGLNAVSAAAKNVNLTNIERGIDNIAAKFSVLGVVAATAISKMTTAAINFGKNFLNDILDPLLAGGAKRAENIQQAKFQFEGLGIDVEKAMASAKAAVLGTAFSLDEAAKVASQFGASGLQAGADMTSALRAVAGVAALTGDSFGDIGNIFTTIAGNGRLMGEQLLQFSSHGINAAAALAKQMGITEAQVRKLVSEGKISFEQFYKAMDAAFGAHAKDAGRLFTGALANVHAALARIGADIQTPKLEAYRDVLNALIPVIDQIHAVAQPAIDALGEFDKVASANVVKKLGKIDLSGFKVVVPPIIQTVTNVGKALLAFIEPIRRAFSSIFPPVTIAQILRVVLALQAFTAKLELSAVGANRVYRIFRGVFAVLDIGRLIIIEVAKMIGRLFGVSLQGSGTLFERLAQLGDFLVKVRDYIKAGNGLVLFFQYLGDVLKVPILLLHALSDALDSVFHVAKDNGPKAAGSMEKLAQSVKPLGRLGELVLAVWAGVLKFTGDIVRDFAPLTEAFRKYFVNVTKGMYNAFKKVDYKGILDTINTGLFAGLIALLVKFESGGLKINLFGTRTLFSVGKAFNGLRITLAAFSQLLRAETLIKIAIAIAALAASVIFLSTVDSAGLTRATTAVAFLFTQLVLSMGALDKLMTQMSVLKMTTLGIALITLAIAVDILASAAVKLSKVDWNGLAKGLSGLGVMLGEIVAAVRLMPNDAKFTSAAVGMILLAVAVRILVGAVTDLSGLSWEELAKGIGAVAVLLGSLTLFARFAKANSTGLLAGAGLVLLAVSIKILASAMKDISGISWENIGKGVATMLVILAMIAAALIIIPPTAPLAGAGILLVALSMGMIADALAKLGQMDWGGIAKAVVLLFGALLLIAAALIIIPPTAVLGAAGILIVAISLGMIADALERFAKFSWGEILKATVTLLLTLGIIAGAMALMTGALPGAAALFIVANALAVLTAVLLVLGKTPISEILIGLGALTLLLAILAVAAYVIEPVVPALLGIGAAMFLIGAGLALAGLGLVLFSAGLAALGVAGAAGAVGFTAIVGAILGLIPALLETIKSTVVVLIGILAAAIPPLVELIIDLILALLKGIEKIAPPLFEALGHLLILLLKFLEDAVPEMARAGLHILLGIMHGISDNIGEIVTTGADILIHFLDAIAKKLPEVIQAGYNLLLSFINGITDAVNKNSDTLGKAGGDMAVAIVKGMVKGIAAGAGEIADAAKNAAKDALNAAKKFLGIASPSKEFFKVGQFSSQGMALGIARYATLVTRATEQMGSDALGTLTKTFSNLNDVVNSNIDPNPVIAPVLDLTTFKKDVAQIGDVLSTTPLSVGTSLSSAQAAANGIQANQDQAAVNAAETSGTNLNYTQNIISPKAPSPADIYRQTKNQLATVTGGTP